MSLRRFALVFALMILVSIVPGQALAQTTAWVQQFGTSSYEEAWQPLVAGNAVYVSGWTDGVLPGQVSAGDSDGFLTAYDLNGGELWTTQFGTDAVDRAWSLADDGTGLYVTGVTDGVFSGQTSAGGSDAYVAKFALDGTPLWVTQFGTPKYDLGSNVVADASGVYVEGTTQGTFTGQTKAGRNDVFQARLASDGTLDWVVQFGSPDDDFAFVNTIGPDGIYVNGYTSGTMGARNRGGFDAFVALFQADGTMTWLRQFGTKQNDSAYGLAADASGVYVTGDTQGQLKGQVDRRGIDAFARLLSPVDGSTVWTHQFGSSGDDTSFGAFVSNGELYAVGVTNGAFGGNVSAGGDDAFIQSIDAATGAKVWTDQFGTSKDDVGYADWVDGSAVYAVGVTHGAFAGSTHLGSGDAFVTRIDLP
jgi:hypothetical protein